MKFLTEIINWVLTLSTFVVFFVSDFNKINEKSSVWGKYSIALLALSLIAGSVLWWMKELRMRKKLLYVKSIPELTVIISKFNAKFTSDNPISSLKQLTNDLGDFYMKLKGIDCCITVKLMGADRLITKARCERFAKERSKKNREDNIKAGETMETFISKNSDLEVIFQLFQKLKAKDIYFFSNDLVKHQGYKNSSIPDSYYNRVNVSRNIFRSFVQDEHWPLPYKSTVVVPIANMHAESDGDQLTGVLCLDSPKKNVFDKDLDLHILQHVSESLFVRISQEMNKTDNKKN